MSVLAWHCFAVTVVLEAGSLLGSFGFKQMGNMKKTTGYSSMTWMTLEGEQTLS